MSNTNYQKKTSIGGSALIEGVMMRGPRRMAMAVRKTDGSIDLSDWELPAERPWYKTTPIIRGVFNFIDSMKDSYQCLMKSADIAGLESEEPSGFEKKLLDLFGENLSKVFGGVAMILGMALAILLFMVLPTLLIGQIRRVIVSPLLLSLIEAAVKIGIFILYLFAISRMSDIRRVFEYHGAEHKTIACYEAGDELTPENAAKYTRFHPRCGTSFLIIVILVSIIVFSAIGGGGALWRVGSRVVLLPLVIGVSYEFIRAASNSDTWGAWSIKPALLLQYITTREPSPDQLEVAIAALGVALDPSKDITTAGGAEDGTDR